MWGLEEGNFCTQRGGTYEEEEECGIPDSQMLSGCMKGREEVKVW